VCRSQAEPTRGWRRLLQWLDRPGFVLDDAANNLCAFAHYSNEGGVLEIVVVVGGSAYRPRLTRRSAIELIETRTHALAMTVDRRFKTITMAGQPTMTVAVEPQPEGKASTVGVTNGDGVQVMTLAVGRGSAEPAESHLGRQLARVVISEGDLNDDDVLLVAAFVFHLWK
jgi:hypothetical protein